MNNTQKEKQISEIRKRIQEIGEQIQDTNHPDWLELVTKRNSLSATLKGLKSNRARYQRKKPYMNTVSLKQWGI